jgi:hypothetical protein
MATAFQPNAFQFGAFQIDVQFWLAPAEVAVLIKVVK